MDKKIIFFDIDGTLVDEKKNIPPSTKLAIQELKRNGAHVVIATGRPPFMFKQIREELEIDSYISFNGQHVVFEGKTIYENPIKQHELIRLHEDSVNNNFPMIYMSDSEMRATIADHIYIKEGLSRLKFYYPETDINFHMNETIFQALLFCEKDQENPLVLAHQTFHFLRWHKYSIDILPVGGSKAIGIKKIISASGLNKEDSFAFGDGLNDLEMLQEVGTGIAMGNAREELKVVADYITEDVENEGILRGLQKYKLI